MAGLKTGESLWLQDDRFRRRIFLGEARVKDQFSVHLSAFQDTVDLTSLEVGISALLTDAIFWKDLRMWNARIGGLADLRRSTFEGFTDLGGIRTGAQLYLGGCATYIGRVRLRGANI